MGTNAERAEEIQEHYIRDNFLPRRQRACRHTLRCLARYRQSARLLEIGSSGGVLCQARRMGWQAVGMALATAPCSAEPLPNSGRHDFQTPGDNGTWTNDWLLIVESAASPAATAPAPWFDFRRF